MFTARSDHKVLGYLGRALSLELTAVQQYSTQARLVASWGLSDAAASFRKEAEEEMKHAERIIERMLACGASPGSSQLRPVAMAPDLSALLKLNQQFEQDVISLYQAAVGYSATAGDQDSRIFFEELLREEQQHLAELQAWAERLKQATVLRRGTR